jgi:hypothetical protein
MEKINKKQVREAFKEARAIMREIESRLSEMDKLDPEYLREEADLGQLGLFLVAEVSTFTQYREYLLYR